MTHDEIISMAREAGFCFYETMHVWTTPTENMPYPEGIYTENLERFAALVVAGHDWSLLEATQESLREHMAEVKRLRSLLEKAYGIKGEA